MYPKYFILLRELVSQIISPFYVVELKELLWEADVVFYFKNNLLSCTLLCDFYPCLDFSLVLGRSKNSRHLAAFPAGFVLPSDFQRLFNAILCKYSCIFFFGTFLTTYIVSVSSRCGIKPRNFILYICSHKRRNLILKIESGILKFLTVVSQLNSGESIKQRRFFSVHYYFERG